MANIEQQNTLPLGAITTYRIVDMIDSKIAGFREWNTARKTAIALNSLTDAQLEDIGITRGDIVSAARA